MVLCPSVKESEALASFCMARGPTGRQCPGPLPLSDPTSKSVCRAVSHSLCLRKLLGALLPLHFSKFTKGLGCREGRGVATEENALLEQRLLCCETSATDTTSHPKDKSRPGAMRSGE